MERLRQGFDHIAHSISRIPFIHKYRFEKKVIEGLKEIAPNTVFRVKNTQIKRRHLVVAAMLGITLGGVGFLAHKMLGRHTKS